jgi:hypothetical protein
MYQVGVVSNLKFWNRSSSWWTERARDAMLEVNFNNANNNCGYAESKEYAFKFNSLIEVDEAHIQLETPSQRPLTGRTRCRSGICAGSCRGNVDWLHGREQKDLLYVWRRRAGCVKFYGRGKPKKSISLVESVKNMTSRSIPIPQPPVGGRPCSRLYWIDNGVELILREEWLTHQGRSRQPLAPRHLPVLSASPAESRVEVRNYGAPQRKLGNHTHLLLEAQSLFKWIVQLGISVAELLSTHEPFEALAEAWARAVPLGKGWHYLWMPDLFGSH